MYRVARFFFVQHTKMEKIFRIVRQYTKRPQNIPISRKIDQMFIKYANTYLPLRDPPNFTQIGVFGFENLRSGNPGYVA
jgi:hypothetical protein